MRIVKKDIHKQYERKAVSSATYRANDRSPASLWQFNICNQNILSYRKSKNESFFLYLVFECRWALRTTLTSDVSNFACQRSP